MKSILFKLSLPCLILFIACQKDAPELQSNGIAFYPSNIRLVKNSSTMNFDFNGFELFFWGEQSFRGAGISYGILTLPYKISDTSYFTLDGALSYNLTNGSFQNQTFNLSDSNRTYDLLKTDDNQYIMVSTDFNRGNLNKIMLLDNAFKPIRQKFILDGVRNRNFIHLAALNNGNYVTMYDGIFPDNFITCFNKSLDFLWTIKLPYSSTFLWVGENSILLGSINSIEQFDYSGKKIRSLQFPPDYEIQNAVQVPGGFVVLGAFKRADKFQVMFAHHYDNDLKLLQSKLLETSKFSKNPNYTFYFRSNILVEKDGYYFALNMRNPSLSNLKVEDAILIKLDKNFNLQFVKEIDYRRKSLENTYLTSYNNKLFCVGPSVWNELQGYSFIKMDMDGNIEQ